MGKKKGKSTLTTIDEQRKREKKAADKPDTAAERIAAKNERREKQPWLRSDSQTSQQAKLGCNSPSGCLRGEPIPAGARQLPVGAVCVRCSNENCPAVPWLHGECYDKWEKHLIRIMSNSRGNARDFSERQVYKYLWNARFYSLIHQECHCPAPDCNGKLMREQAEEKLASASAVVKSSSQKSPGCQKSLRQTAAEAPGPGKSKELPKLGRSADFGYFRASSGATASTAARGYVPSREKVVVQRSLGSQQNDRTRTMSEASSHSYGLGVGLGGWEDSVSEAGSSASDRSRFLSGYVSRKQNQGTFVNDFYEVDSWPILPGAASHPLPNEDSGRSEIFRGDIPDDSSGLSKERFLSDLESSVRIYGGCLPENQVIVQDLLAKCGLSLMSEMCEFGGFAHWLLLNSEKMRVMRGQILLKGLQNAQNQLDGVGTVVEVARTDDGEISGGMIECAQYGSLHIWFNSVSEVNDGSTEFLKDDVVSFLAVEMKNPVNNCQWLVAEMSLLQRGGGTDQTDSVDSYAFPSSGGDPYALSRPSDESDTFRNSWEQGTLGGGRRFPKLPTRFDGDLCSFPAAEKVESPLPQIEADLPPSSVQQKSTKKISSLLDWKPPTSIGDMDRTITNPVPKFRDQDLFPVKIGNSRVTTESHNPFRTLENTRDGTLSMQELLDSSPFTSAGQCYSDTSTSVGTVIDPGPLNSSSSGSDFCTVAEETNTVDGASNNRHSCTSEDTFDEQTMLHCNADHMMTVTDLKVVPTAVVAPGSHEKVDNCGVEEKPISEESQSEEDITEIPKNNNYAKMLEGHLGPSSSAVANAVPDDLSQWEKILEELKK